jgi:chromosome partitioning protein
MKTITLLSQKGGAGKTTLALCIAVAAALDRRTTAVLDLDPQATACSWGDRREADSPAITDVQPARLQKALERADQEGCDLVVLDTPPRSEHAALEAAKAADLIVLPVRPSIYDLETLRASQDLIRMAGADKPAVVVLNAVPARGSRGHEAEKAITGLGLAVLDRHLGHRQAYADAATLGLTPQEYEPSGKAALECRNVYMAIFEHAVMKDA